MKVTRAGVDRSTNYSPDEFDTISVVLVGWDGEVGQGTVPIPDPSGNQEPYEGEQLLLEQDSLTILDGFLGSITTDRGGSSAGTRRVHTVTLADDNALLSGHATASWTRPAEAPAARWTAFVAAFLPGSITTTWLLTTNESGITLPKKVYRSDSLFDDISADTIGPTGKTVYMEHRNFHWHLPTEGQTCSLSIHDTTFNNSTSFFPDPKAQRSKDGMDLRTKIYARNDAGVVVSVQDTTAITRHEAAGLKHQGYSEYGSETSAEMTRDINVTLAERKAERTTWTYTIGPLTAAQVVELIPGSQMTVTVGLHGLSAAVKRIARVSLAYKHGRDSRHFMATLELGYPRRVKRKPTKNTSPADSTGGSGVAGSGGGPHSGHSGNCGCDPWTLIGSETQADMHRGWGIGRVRTGSAGGDLLQDRVGGDSLGLTALGIGTSITAENAPGPPGFYPTETEGREFIQHAPPAGAGAARMRARIFAWSLTSPAPTEDLNWVVWQGNWDLPDVVGPTVLPRNIDPGFDPTYDGMLMLDGSLNPVVLGSGSLVPAAVAASAMPVGGYADIDIVIPVVDGKLQFVIGWNNQLTLNASEAGGSTTAYVGARFPALADDRNVSDSIILTPLQTLDLSDAYAAQGYTIDWQMGVVPARGQEVPRTVIGTADGSTTVYSTPYPYLPGSLHVFVDDVREFHVEETDPTAGSFTFSTTPFSGEEISGDFRGVGE